MYKYYILPYKMGSQSAKNLADSLNCRRIFPDRRYRSKPNHVLINWGYSTRPEVPIQSCRKILNQPSSIPYVSNKLKFFLFPSGGQKVPYTTDKSLAKDWTYRDTQVYCRTIVNGRGGEGIVIATTPDEVVDAPLYTANIRTAGSIEYRIHIFQNEIFHYQQKRKMTTEKLEELGITHNPKIKNYRNGYVFAINDCEEPREDTFRNALFLMRDYGLDFGAVDIIQTPLTSWVLEVNSAPGLEGTTLEKYTQKFKSYLRRL